MTVYLSSQKIIKDWIDYNDHMNVSYYLLIFDKYGADTLNDLFQMGEDSAKKTKKSTMIVETHITFNQELRGKVVKCSFRVCQLIILSFDSAPTRSGRCKIQRQNFRGTQAPVLCITSSSE